MKLLLTLFKSTFWDIQLSYTSYSEYSSHWSLMVYLAYSNLSTMFLQECFYKTELIYSVYMIVTKIILKCLCTRITTKRRVYLSYSCSMAILPSIPSNFLSKHILALTEASSLIWKCKYRIQKANQKWKAKEVSTAPQGSDCCLRFKIISKTQPTWTCIKQEKVCKICFKFKKKPPFKSLLPFYFFKTNFKSLFWHTGCSNLFF